MGGQRPSNRFQAANIAAVVDAKDGYTCPKSCWADHVCQILARLVHMTNNSSLNNSHLRWVHLGMIGHGKTWQIEIAVHLAQDEDLVKTPRCLCISAAVAVREVVLRGSAWFFPLLLEDSHPLGS